MPPGHGPQNKEPDDKIGQNLQESLEGERRDEREAQKAEPRELDRVELLIGIGGGRKNPDQELGKRHKLDDGEDEKPEEEKFRPLQGEPERPIYPGLMHHQDVGGEHDEHGELDHKDGPFIDRGRGERGENQEPEQAVFDDPGKDHVAGWVVCVIDHSLQAALCEDLVGERNSLDRIRECLLLFFPIHPIRVMTIILRIIRPFLSQIHPVQDNPDDLRPGPLQLLDCG